MNKQSVQLNDVIYNATEQCFEALVSVHGAEGTKRYACSINAPISMSFEEAAAGLTRQALRRHAGKPNLSSTLRTIPMPQRAGRPRFDPVRWLESIVNLPGRHAA